MRDECIVNGHRYLVVAAPELDTKKISYCDFCDAAASRSQCLALPPCAMLSREMVIFVMPRNLEQYVGQYVAAKLGA